MITKYPSISNDMNKLLDLVIELNLENSLTDFQSEKFSEKLFFKNSKSAGYFMFQLEILIPKFNFENKILQLIGSELIISERI